MDNQKIQDLEKIFKAGCDAVCLPNDKPQTLTEFLNGNEDLALALGIGAVMHRLYQEISREYKVPVDRIMLAITDDAKSFQAYSTNEMEVELFYLCDVPVPNGA